MLLRVYFVINTHSNVLTVIDCLINYCNLSAFLSSWSLFKKKTQPLLRGLDRRDNVKGIMTIIISESERSCKNKTAFMFSQDF